MADPKTTAALSQMPPGSRFYPSEQQLLSYYLRYRNNPSSANPSGYDVIKEINLYNYSPFDLPEVSCFRYGYKGRKRHWYCYTERFNCGEGRERERRAAELGYWKKKGKVRDVMREIGGKVVLGRRSCFVFYMDKYFDAQGSKSSVRTDWMMYEYALTDNLEASFVLCRVFVKPRGQSNTSEHPLSSCAEESAATVRHIGVQHDGSLTSDIGEAGAFVNEYAGKNKITSISTGIAESCKFPSGIQPNNLVRSPELGDAHTMFFDTTDAQQLACILDGDFIELDDLV
ncbi:hypothetical protein Nepgr_005857 [Nepenthes gracilis]|uniref:NAC domain-containing protein n=1 Tax=Nepenthes gracilis TaxID=150966 RepID=A0AAD3XGV2_NEPGR|nr:hypothetical protein Nepgr_005857 [Nepenthes gracilis]